MDEADHLRSGLELMRAGAYFEAHEELELAWRAAAPDERDFFQGLVHVTVAWYQAGRGNVTGCRRQLEKAARRLAPYTPRHRGVDVAALLRQVAAADPGALPLRRLQVVEAERREPPVEGHLEPPVPVEEEQ